MLSFGLSVALARLLGPAAFGLVAAATLPISFATLVVEGGLSAALVQKRRLTRDDVAYVATVQTAVGLAATLAIALAAPLTERLLGIEGLAKLVLYLSPLAVVNALAQAPSAILKRNMQYRAIQLGSVISYILGFGLIGLPLALAGAAEMSLVAANLSQSATRSLIYLALAKTGFRIRIRGDISLVGFGTKVMLSSVTNWAVSNIDTLVIARTMTPMVLGWYNRAFTLASMPLTIIVGSLQSVVFSVVSRMDGDSVAAGRALRASIGIASGLAIPAYAWLATMSTPIISFLLGPSWIDAAHLVLPLAIALSTSSVVAIAGPVLSGLGRADVEFRQTVYAAVIAGLLIPAASQMGEVLAVAWAVALSRAAFLILLLVPLTRLTRSSLTSFALSMAPGALSGLVVWMTSQVVFAWGARSAIPLSLLLALTLVPTIASVVLWYRAVGYREIAALSKTNSAMPAEKVLPT